ncbi:hypothetical protein RCL1_002147 [Eukaryota sp. TZLM3-RCL]
MPPISPPKPYTKAPEDPRPSSPPMSSTSPARLFEKEPSGELGAPGPILPDRSMKARTPSQRHDKGREVPRFLVNPPGKNAVRPQQPGSFVRPIPEELSSTSITEILNMEDDAETSPKARMGLLWRLVSAYLPFDTSTILRHVASHLEFSLARSRFSYDPEALFIATAYSIRDRLLQFWNDTNQNFNATMTKRAYYLSIEYLMGRQLLNNLVNLDLLAEYRNALLQLGFPLEALLDQERDAALGNGGLGRLAACMLDSAATLNMPVWGYGLRYKYGMFRQEVRGGYQVELPDYMTTENPWLVERSDVQYEVMFYGSVTTPDASGRASWSSGQVIIATAHDFPIPGFGTYNCTNLRLWSSRPSKEFDLHAFNAGEYYKIVEQRQDAENLTSVLYPDDSTEGGRILRLKQQYFFVAASLADIVRRFKKQMGRNLDWDKFPEFNVLQLNDTHPSLAIPEFLRILLDIEKLPFERAFNILKNSFNYTCHTLLPEALERWPAQSLGELLPRHLQLIFLINHHHLDSCRSVLGATHPSIPHLSLVEEGVDKMVRMANLCVVGSSVVNGVARMHGELMKKHVFKHFASLEPSKFIHITNGFTQRRWLLLCNPHLAQTISECIGGDQWMSNLQDLDRIRAFADDKSFQELWFSSKLKAKKRLADWVARELKVTVDPERMMFDIMVKRIHEYKRQLMNILACIAYYLRIRSMTNDERSRLVPRAVFIGGKAAPGYYRAKLIIKLINSVQDVINADPVCSTYFTVVFIPNYCVSVAELVIPAADVSQHISTAGTEASGTSNMKFCLNGVLLLGTKDGASVEIAEKIGEENMFLFGLDSNQVETMRESFKTEKPVVLDKRLRIAISAIESGQFGPSEIFTNIIEDVKSGKDFYLVAADFAAYLDTLERVRSAYLDKSSWIRKTILTCAGMSMFSSDRMTQDYCDKIWNISPCPLPEPYYSEDSRLMISSVSSSMKHHSPLGSEKISHEAAAPPEELSGIGL